MLIIGNAIDGFCFYILTDRLSGGRFFLLRRFLLPILPALCKGLLCLLIDFHLPFGMLQTIRIIHSTADAQDHQVEDERRCDNMRFFQRSSSRLFLAQGVCCLITKRSGAPSFIYFNEYPISMQEQKNRRTLSESSANRMIQQVSRLYQENQDQYLTLDLNARLSLAAI